MWIGVVENFHLSIQKLSALETLEARVMGESGINSYTLQTFAHYGRLFTLEVFTEVPASRPEDEERAAGHKMIGALPLENKPPGLIQGAAVYGAAEFMLSFEDNSHAHLFGFYVDEIFRARGAASMFIKLCEKRLADAYSIKTIDLSVSEDNPRAAAFYKKNGYAALKFLRDYYGPGRGRHIMFKTL
jgi:ribosomal protein S18 acetylase RimI-like enzyme